MSLLTCPHDEHHHNDDELPRPELTGLPDFLHGDFVYKEIHGSCQLDGTSHS